MKCGVVLLPGSNCDHDVYHVLKHTLGQETVFLWHENESVEACDLVVVPGGFSYGDYLRSGALAARSPVLAAVRRHADAGGLVLGICNGFQILCEAGLLPGALLRNRSLRFEHRDVCLRVERDDLAFTRRYRKGQVLSIPIAHMDGNYFGTEAALDELEAAGRVVFRYASPDGGLDDAWNWNGSARAIAGIVNAGGNVLGMMPHPERASDPLLGSTDGLALFEAAVESLKESLEVAR
ncbi:MAG TPA: phosphoribosylformylglycinamidine synthase subunit PurQ [Thermoanaerobaculia bacterium]|nr:phosphoribosylformylglycinamidine synthase subunit PurQ [Thermoanaerobaculia bacterium]